MAIVVEVLHPRAREEHFGLIPAFLSDQDERKAVEQLDANYRHGGGWMPMKGWKLFENDILKYEGDPPYEPLGRIQLRDERVVIYQHSWVAVIQKDGSFEVARMD